ncbi:MAG: cation:proton antiporter [Muribaculaceae bacterium]|nr:cation:proton antiporter [Muribaculaceae bacterium]
MTTAPLASSPITIFFIVLAIILLAPILLNRLRIPHIVGMIVAGVVVGPYGFHILDRDSSFQIFGEVGILYLMFLAGLEIDMYHLKLNFRKGIFFGLLTFAIPMAMGTVVSYYALHLNLPTSVLLASMFASHTLISYPVAARYGVTKAPSVLISVVGTIFAVVGALIALATVVNINNEGTFNPAATLLLLGEMTIYCIVIAWLYPRLTRFFFKRFSDRVTQYVFVLALVFLSAWIAKAIGLEGVLGAFLAGLVLNRYVPPASPLMSRIEFVGNAIFIPYFLIGVGMMINLGLVANWATLTVSGIMLAVALASKWIAAWVAQLYYHMKASDRRMFFGLTTAHTAVALAVVTIGYNTFLPDGSRMMDETILNSTVLVILITCAIAPIVTARAAAAIKLQMLEEEEAGDDTDTSSNHRNAVNMLIPVSNPVTAPGLMELAIMLSGFHRPRTDLSVYTLHVRNDNTSKSRAVGRVSLDLARQVASAADLPVTPIERFDLNTVTGVVNVTEERDINAIVMGMHRKSTVVDSFLGPKIEQLLSLTRRMLVIARCYTPVNTVARIIVYAQPNSQFEAGFRQWVMTVGNLAQELGCRIMFCCPPDMHPAIRSVLRREKYTIRAHFRNVSDRDDFLIMAGKLHDDDLFIWISSRPGSVSWSTDTTELPAFISRYFSRNNLIVIYPEISADGMRVQTFADPLAVDFAVGSSSIWVKILQWWNAVISRYRRRTGRGRRPSDLDL